MMSIAARRGRKFVIGLVVFNVLLALAAFAILVAYERWDRLPKFSARVAANVAGVYYLWTGTRWVQWLWVIGLGGAGLLCLWLPVRFPQTFSYAVMGPISLPLFAAGCHLALSADVQAFFRYQRGETETESALEADADEMQWEKID